MSQVQEKYQEAESNYGSDLLNLVVAKGYLTKLLANEAVKSYIGRHEPEILTQLELVVNTVSMEEAVQQQQELAGEVEDDLETDDAPAAVVELSDLKSNEIDNNGDKNDQTDLT